MKSPEDVAQWVQQRYLRQRWRWLDGHGVWPLQVPLGRPTQKMALARPDAVKTWSSAWGAWRDTHSTNGAGATGPALLTTTVAWSSVGPQTLPEALSFPSPASVAEHCGEGAKWRRIVHRRELMLERWPALAVSGFGPHYESLGSYDEHDFSRLLDLLDWFIANPKSGLYLRQLPVTGIDTKWVDRRRKGIVADLLKRITRPSSIPAELPDDEAGSEEAKLEEMGSDFYEVCGLRRPATRLRMIVLCPALREQLGGLRDVESTIEDLAQLKLKPEQLLVVENRDTGLCLPDVPGVIAIIKLGNSVPLIQQLPWLNQVPVVYWGDIDTYGYSILALARKTLGPVRSVLMDEATLTAHLDRLVAEGEQAKGVERSLLNEAEKQVYEGLIAGTWGASRRLEQERLEWPVALQAVLEALAAR